MSQLLDTLNEPQRAAVVNYDVPSLIVAGAGSGKTRVLTSRIAYMLEQGIAPNSILALTFTNKAAREMRERIGKIVSSSQSYRLWMGTFHSIFLKILRVEAEWLGYTSSFTIYDTASSKNLLKTIIKEMNLNDEHYKVNNIFSRISLAKNNLVTPDSYLANSTYISEDRERRIPEFSTIYQEYAKRCKANGAMDFDDMLLNINILFRDFPDVLAKYQRMFNYILVDEYQDTNYAQYIIIRRLSQLHSRVCVVGDDAQSIYSFRGAKVENILRFKNDFPTAQTFKLEQNYRSTQNIVNAANSVISKNKNRIKKESFSAGEQGDLIKVIRAYTDQEEASLVADRLRRYVREGASYGDVAILYRTNMQSRAFEDAFRRRTIPYRIYGGMSFYQRKEVKDIMAYMQLITNFADNEAFKRVINFPARGIGGVTLGKIAEVALQRDMSYLEVVSQIDSQEIGLKGTTAIKVRDFGTMIVELSKLRSTMSLYDFGMEVATRSGVISSYRAAQTPDAQSALDNIEELLNTMQIYEQQLKDDSQYDEQTGEAITGVSEVASVESWLQNVMLLTDMDGEDEVEGNKVTLMTVHASKGLEFDYLFIVGLEENLFPSLMSIDGQQGLEEERRLFYVALTRACKSATLSFSQSRFKWGASQFCTPSRFLKEIDPKYLEIDFDLDGSSKRESSEGGQSQRRWGDRSGRGGSQSGGSDGSPRWQQNNRRPTPTPMSAEAIAASGQFKSVGVRSVDKDQPKAVEPVAAQSVGEYSVGMKVNHAKFGDGVVQAVEQTATDVKIKVEFEGGDTKTLLSKFAKLTII